MIKLFLCVTLWVFCCFHTASLSAQSVQEEVKYAKMQGFLRGQLGSSLCDKVMRNFQNMKKNFGAAHDVWCLMGALLITGDDKTIQLHRDILNSGYRRTNDLIGQMGYQWGNQVLNKIENHILGAWQKVEPMLPSFDAAIQPQILSWIIMPWTWDWQSYLAGARPAGIAGDWDSFWKGIVVTRDVATVFGSKCERSASLPFFYNGHIKDIQIPAVDPLALRDELLANQTSLRKNVLRLSETLHPVCPTFLYKAEGKPKTMTRREGGITVKNRSAEAAIEDFVSRGGKTGVLNLANTSMLGGGVRNGKTAQEESVMRFLPQVWVSYLEYMKDKEAPFIPITEVLVTSCLYRGHEMCVIAGALPALSGKGLEISVYDEKFYGKKILEETEYKDIVCKNIRNALRAARDQGVTNLILGAWGCGVYNNPPGIVAACFKEILDENDEATGFPRKNLFEHIEFAILEGRNTPLNHAFSVLASS